MYRARYRHVSRHVVYSATHVVASCTPRRFYTPVCTTAPSVDHMESVRLEDEMNTLWTSTTPVPSLARAVELWLRYGNDPVVHTRRSLLAGSPLASSIHELQTSTNQRSDDTDVKTEKSAGKPSTSKVGSSPLLHAAQELTRSNSPFAFVEDYMGTNLARTGDPAHVRESAELWLSYFERRYLSRMRQSRRTAANFIGKPIERGSGSNSSGLTANALSTSSDAADVGAMTDTPLFTDEADQPNTPWSRDTLFGELAYLSERHLKFKPANMLQLEQQLWYAATPEQLVAYFDALQQQTSTRVPLPVPAIWYLEGPARLVWATTYLPAAHAARAFFDGPLSESIRERGGGTAQAAGSASAGSMGGATVVLQRVAAHLKEVYALERARARRQMAEGIRPDWHTAEPTPAHTRLCQAWSENELERWQRGVQEAVYDAEDMMDTSEAWRRESADITACMNRRVEGCHFTLYDFWLHTIRREELETQHILEMDKLRAIAAGARDALYHESSLEYIHTELGESLARGQLDLRAASLRPQLRPVWCKWHYAKFGASTTAQHTTTASRQLLFHFAASVREVAATAMLYYTTKPLSSALDYSSPYTWRRSMARWCASYGLDMTHATQAPLFQSAAQLARAEDVMTRVVNEVARRCGRQRRRRERAVRRADGVDAVSGVWVGEVPRELLSTGDSVSWGEGNTRASHSAVPVTEWPLGSRKLVYYHWPCPAWRALQEAQTDANVPGKALHRCSDPSLDGGVVTASPAVWLEVSLWRRCGAAERAARRRAAAAETAAVSRAVSGTPVLAEVARYAQRLYEHLSPMCRASSHTATSSNSVGAACTQDGSVDTGKTTRSSRHTNGAHDAVPDTEETADAEEDGEWVFAVMLDDRVGVRAAECADVYLPYTDASGAPLPAGEYRVCVRGYHNASPAHSAWRAWSDENRADTGAYAEAVSESFAVRDILDDAIAEAVSSAPAAARPPRSSFSSSSSSVKEDGLLSAAVPVVPGEMWVELCDGLRRRGLDIPLRAEFEAGQTLDPQGHVFLVPFLSALRGSSHHRPLAEMHLTAVQRAMEPDCRAHWELYHPGATAVEWARARRAVLQRAVHVERDWWLPDALLDLRDNPVTASSAHASLGCDMYAAVARYGNELCGVLRAEGVGVCAREESKEEVTACVAAHCTVDGTGAATALQLAWTDASTSGESSPPSSTQSTVDAALDVALGAIRAAQNRHATLSMFKLSAFEKQAQVSNFCNVHGLEFGGKYARTYCYALEQAKTELAEVEVGGKREVGVRDADQERVSDQACVDRFASSTHPEQRKTRFVPRTTLAGVNIEDPTPDQTSTWRH